MWNILFLLWTQPLPCTVDTFVLNRGPGELRYPGGYFAGNALFLETTVGTALYSLAPPRPDPVAILRGWHVFVSSWFRGSDMPPAVYRYAGDPPSFQVAEVDPRSGLITGEVTLPGVPLVNLVYAFPLLGDRFILGIRSPLPEGRFTTRLLLFARKPLRLLDTLTVGAALPSWGALPRIWEEAGVWVWASQVPHNRGMPARGSRDDLGSVILLSPDGRVIRSRQFPWPLFAMPHVLCRFAEGRCVMSAVPVWASPPGLPTRVWILHLPDLAVERSFDLPGQAVAALLEDGMLILEVEKARARILRDGETLTVHLPEPLREDALRTSHPDGRGIWFLLRERPPRTPDPRWTDGPPRRSDVLYLSPQGYVFQRFPFLFAPAFVPEPGVLVHPLRVSPRHIEMGRFRCASGGSP